MSDKLRFAPCLPSGWASFKIHYRYRETVYHITLRNSGIERTVRQIFLDGNEQAERCVPLMDDRNDHHVEVEVSKLSIARTHLWWIFRNAACQPNPSVKRWQRWPLIILGRRVQ